MSMFLLAGAIFILLTVGAGWLRAMRGPTDADRIMAVQLIGSGGIAVLLLLLATTGAPGIADVSLILALLSAFLVAAFAHTTSPRRDTSTRERS